MTSVTNCVSRAVPGIYEKKVPSIASDKLIKENGDLEPSSLSNMVAGVKAKDPLAEAIKAGDLERVESYLKEGLQVVNRPIPDELDHLFLAKRGENSAIIKLISDHAFSKYPINRWIDIAQWLVSNKRDDLLDELIEMMKPKFQAALEWATQLDHVELVGRMMQWAQTSSLEIETLSLLKKAQSIDAVDLLLNENSSLIIEADGLLLGRLISMSTKGTTEKYVKLFSLLLPHMNQTQRDQVFLRALKSKNLTVQDLISAVDPHVLSRSKIKSHR